MTKEYVQYRIEKHNNEVNNFINTQLKQRLGIKGDTINMNQWFKAQDIIKEQDFYNRGRLVQTELREAGFDVKMNMQSNELILY